MDELNSAIEVGAAGEEKITHSLWPQDTLLTTDPIRTANSFYEEAAVEGKLDSVSADVGSSSKRTVRFPKAHISK